ncbi:metallophosphoesterase family protein [Paenibacillus sp. MMS20-IR301]|nr:metallophosphoesterase family protein [Paenibacillus sp. MMS20-IR301]WNS46829.1 metallophosphoesterase family protein [Paenibacillus sp. MMS20-IR301]
MSDIHGCIQEFNLLLRRAAYNPQEDQLILLGDYVDRGKDSRAVVERVMQLAEDCGVIVLRGNHDQMAYDALTGQDDKRDTHWITNGGFDTMLSYCGGTASVLLRHDSSWKDYAEMKEYICREYKEQLDFLGSLPLYYETDTHLYVHAGIDPSLADWKSQRDYDFIWIREPFYNHPVTSTAKTVVFGHTSTTDLQDGPEIWFSPLGDKIGIDGGCVYGEQLNCLEIGDEGYKTYAVRLGEVE